MANKYSISNAALQDLEDIWLYTVKTWSLDQADLYYHNFIATFERLALSPQDGKSVDDLREGYFRYSVGKHFVFYKEIPQGILIVRVLGQMMDIPSHI